MKRSLSAFIAPVLSTVSAGTTKKEELHIIPAFTLLNQVVKILISKFFQSAKYARLETNNKSLIAHNRTSVFGLDYRHLNIHILTRML